MSEFLRQKTFELTRPVRKLVGHIQTLGMSPSKQVRLYAEHDTGKPRSPAISVINDRLDNKNFIQKAIKQGAGREFVRATFKRDEEDF